MIIREIREDGVMVTRFTPSEHVRAFPTYREWKEFLLSRGLAVAIPDPRGRRHEDGSVKKSLKPCEQHASVIDGHVKMMCINCGSFASHFNMSQITIGAVIRMEKEEQTIPDEIIVRTKLQPVMKTGMGCIDCQYAYLKAIQITSAENKIREQMALVQAKMALLTTVKTKGVVTNGQTKLIGQLTPFLNVLEVRQEVM